MYCILFLTEKHLEKRNNNNYRKGLLLNGEKIMIKTKKSPDKYDYYYEVFQENNEYILGNKIGIVGDEESERIILEYRNKIKNKYWRNISKNKLLNGIYEDDPDKDIRIDLTKDKDIFCISIDPKSSEDIDDCLHYKKVNEGFEIGIHIADVSSYIKKESELDKIIFERGETKYFPWKICHMLPKNLSTDIISLRAKKKKKRAISLIIKFNNNYKILSCEIIKSLIINRRELSYEDADLKRLDFIKKGKVNNYIDIGELIQNLFESGYKIMEKRKMNLLVSIFGEGIEYDIHKMVEVYMILANIIIAEKLYNYNPNNLILRTHNGLKENLVNKELFSNNLLILKEINKKKINSAKYTTNKNNIFHYGLNIKYYTHFTSPIRRYIDIYIHRLVTFYIRKKKYDHNDNLDIICDKINLIKKNLKRSQTESKLLDLFYKFYNLNNGVLDTKGYIIEITLEKIKIYSKEIDRSINYYYKNSKTDHLIKIINYDSSKIEFIQYGKNRLFKLYQLVDVKIIFIKNEGLFKNKFNIQII